MPIPGRIPTTVLVVLVALVAFTFGTPDVQAFAKPHFKRTPTITAVVQVPTATPTRTPTRTSTPGGPTVTRTRTPTPTRTVAPGTATLTRTPTRSATPGGVTSTRTATSTPTRTVVSSTATGTPTPTRTVVAGTATRSPTATATATPTSVGALPAFNHAYLLVMENKEYASIVGSSSAPYLNSLIAQYGLATNYVAVSHPSEPNYLALFSGSTQGVIDDNVYNFGGTNLADQLEAKGKTWRVFAQNVPLNCYTGATASGGEDGTGNYARKHEPAISFTDISGNSARCGNISDFTHFSAAAANFTFIAPNLCNDMHDCSVAIGDAWLQSWVPSHILNTSAWATGKNVLFIIWDEGTTSTGGGGHVAALVVSNSLVSAGFKSATAHNHYSLVRTLEDAWGLGCLNNTCGANTLREFFK